MYGLSTEIDDAIETVLYNLVRLVMRKIRYIDSQPHTHTHTHTSSSTNHSHRHNGKFLKRLRGD